MSEKILKGLQIHDLSRGGNGVGRELTQSESNGPERARVVFVPFTLTGDVVTVKVIAEERRFATGEILAVELEVRSVREDQEYLVAGLGLALGHHHGGDLLADDFFEAVFHGKLDPGPKPRFRRPG